MKEKQNISKRDSIRDVSGLCPNMIPHSHCGLKQSEESHLPCHCEAIAEKSHNNIDSSLVSLPQNDKNSRHSNTFSLRHSELRSSEESKNADIPKGYKHTALGILPQDWEVVRLGDIGIFLKGSGISKENLSDSGIACIRYGELYTTYKEVINYVYCKTDMPIQGLVLSKKNDILIPTSGETAIDIATASCILLDGVAIGGDTNIVRTEQNGIYLAYCLNNMMKNRIASLAQGATVIHLYANHLKTLEIPLPPIKEQEKIAQILNTWDSCIQNLEKLIEAKQRYKKGLMQRLLTPPQEDLTSGLPRSLTTSRNDIQALRFKEFSGTWQEVKLGEVFSEYTLFNLNSYPQYTIGKNGIKPFFDTRHTIEKHKAFALFDLIIGIGIDEVNVNIGVDFGEKGI